MLLVGSRIKSGSEFQAIGPATENYGSPEGTWCDNLIIRPDELIIRPDELIIRPNGLIIRPDELLIRSDGLIIRSDSLIFIYSM